MIETQKQQLLDTLTSIGQSFRSYHELLENPNYNIPRRKLAEILSKCAKNCAELKKLELNG